MSAGAVSMSLTELQRWGVVRRVWRPGERKEFYEAETDFWKMISKVFDERERLLAESVRERLERAARCCARLPESMATRAASTGSAASSPSWSWRRRRSTASSSRGGWTSPASATSCAFRSGRWHGGGPEASYGSRSASSRRRARGACCLAAEGPMSIAPHVERACARIRDQGPPVRDQSVLVEPRGHLRAQRARRARRAARASSPLARGRPRRGRARARGLGRAARRSPSASARHLL